MNATPGIAPLSTKVRVIGAFLAALTLTACDNDGPTAGDPPVLADAVVVHAVPDAPDVRVRAGSAIAAADLEFGQASELAFTPGTTSLSVEASTPDGYVTVIGPVDIDFEVDTSYAIIASGQVDATGEPIAPIVITNPNEAVDAGNARVEVVHAAPSAPPVDIYVTAPDELLSGATPIAGGNTPFGANSGQIEVPSGDYQIRVTLPGETTPVFDSGTVTLIDGADLLIVAEDNTGPGSAPIVLFVAANGPDFTILDIGTPADVRVVHAVPDAPPVDVYVNDPMAMDPPAIANLPYTAAAPGSDDYVALEAGTNNVLVTAAGNTGVVAIPATDLALDAGQQYTVYATGTLAAGIEPFVTTDDDRPVATEARVRILHLSPSAGAVDIYVTPPMADITDLEPTFAGVELRGDTGYVELAGGSYDVTVTLADTKTAAIAPVTIDIVNGGTYTAAARDPNPNVANDTFGLILLDDF